MVASGNRTTHTSYDGETVLYVSRDAGKTWETQIVINEQNGIDYRDPGILYLGNNKFLLNYFTAYENASGNRVTANSYVRQGTLTGETIVWGNPVQVPIQSPHGPILLQNGDLFWVGDAMYDPNEGYDKNGDGQNDYSIGSEYAMKSADGGLTWTYVAHIPATAIGAGCEYNTVETATGRLVTSIRMEENGLLYTYVTVSDDNGKTWSNPTFVTCGAPAHLMLHSSGAIVMTYGFRGNGQDDTAYGIRARYSLDNGATWSGEILLDGAAYNADCGYPASVELEDGSICTVYYKKTNSYSKHGVWSLSWSLPLQFPES